MDDLFQINFDDWFNTTLRQELMETSGHSRVLKRRVAWLIGQWLTVRLNPEYRPELYNILIGLLNPEQDMAVRLAATSTLRCAIDDFDFSSEHFIEYLEPMAFSLYKLLVSVRECDTKVFTIKQFMYCECVCAYTINLYNGTVLVKCVTCNVIHGRKIRSDG